MVHPKRKPKLAPRNWSRNNQLGWSVPLYPFCVCIVMLQIMLVLLMNREIVKKPVVRTRNPNPLMLTKPIKSKSRDGAKTFIHSAPPETRPDSDLPGNVRLRSIEEKIRKKFNVEAVKSCRWHRKNALGKMRIVMDDDCDGRELIMYNPLNHDRLVCKNKNVIVPARGFVKVERNCIDPTRWRLFAETPTIEGASLMPPVFVKEADQTFRQDDAIERYGFEDELENANSSNFPCDIPCKQRFTPSTVTRLSIDGTDWVIVYSMESAGYYQEISLDPEAHKDNYFFATTSFESEIPLPYFSWAEYNITTPAVEYDKVIKGASFIATNCESESGRERIVKELSNVFPVFSLGACLHNAEPPDGSSIEDKRSMQQQYLFHLAFENTNETDYVTEKLWATLEAGTLPVYMGAPNIHQHAPHKSIISVHDFDSIETLGAYLHEVANNRSLYESYHAWRKEPLSSVFQEKYNFTHTHSVCRLCRWAHARLYGHAFDHARQIVRETVIARKACIDPTTHLFTHPIHERWLRHSEVLLDSGNNDREGSCQTEGLEQTIQVGTWTRTISNWDGVLDIEIVGTGEDGVYQITLPIKWNETDFHQVGPKQWLVQDSQSRVTLLTSWRASLIMNASAESVIGIEMRGEKSMKLRIILEEIDHFYAEAFMEPSYFGELMVQDFTNPLERFLVMEA